MTSNNAPASRTPERSQLFRGIRHDMSDFFDRFRDFRRFAPGEFFEDLTAPVFPAIDVSEDDKALEITAEIPGVSEADIDVSIMRDTLVLKGEKSSTREEREQDYHVVERRFGSFRRQIPLGFTPAADGIEAKFRNGVLSISVRKPEDAGEPVRKIDISQG